MIKNNKGNSRFEFLKNYSLLNSKRSQVTIFIIIGLMLVVLIAIIFVARIPPKIEVVDEKAPQAFIESCTKDAVEDALNKTSEYGGDISPKFSVKYDDRDKTYLCYTNKFYQPCVNQRPKLIEYIEGQINDYITPKIGECFDELGTNLEKRYDIEMGEMDVNTKLEPKTVVVEISRKINLSRGENSREFDNFKVITLHPMYDLAKIASEIVNQEAHYCNFDNLGYMIIYPEYDISKFETGNADIIYKIKERTSNKEFNFAVRSCALPPGF